MSELKGTDIIPYLSRQSQSLSAYMAKKSPESLWMVDLQRAYFQAAAEAHENGKKLIAIGPDFPPEIIWALDAVPLLLDCLPTRLASENGVLQRFIDIANLYVPDTMCGLNRGDLGLVLDGAIDECDALVYTTTPCDSGRALYSAVAEHVNCPTFFLDTPYRKDERGINYIADGLLSGLEFLEGIVGHKMDWDRLLEVVELSNKGYELLGKVGDLRKLHPVPLQSRFLVLNEFFGGMVGTQEVIDFLQKEYDLGCAMAAAGKGAVRGEEKHRIMLLQNPWWFAVNIFDWIEKTYNSVITIDGFGYWSDNQIDDTSSMRSIFQGFARRQHGAPMGHGSAGPIEANLDLVRRGVEDYDSDIMFFAGHVGCKHTWVAAKALKDLAWDKYGVRTHTFEFDGVDVRFKSADEIKADIAEFMDTLD